MNERIRQLAEQAGFYITIDGSGILIPDPHTEDITEVTTKFAELIVHQMLDITDAHTEVFQTDRDRAVIEHIKQSVKTHFGVEL